MDKINKLLESHTTEALYICLNNIQERELEQIRPFLTEVMSMKLEFLVPKQIPTGQGNMDAI